MRVAWASAVVVVAAMTAVSAVASADGPGQTPVRTPGHTPGQTGCPHGPGQTGPGQTRPGHTGPGQTPGETGCQNTPGHRKRPVVRHLRITPKRFRVASRGRASVARTGGAQITYIVSEAGTARFTIERAAHVTARRGGCTTTTRESRRGCAHRVRLRGSFRQGAVRGRNALHFTGRLRGRRLAPGGYVLVISVVDLTGDRSRAKRTRFRITG